MDYSTGQNAHLWTDYHTISYRCRLLVPALIKERLEEISEARGTPSEVYVNPVFDKKHNYLGGGYLYVTEKSFYNILTAHAPDGSPLEITEEKATPAGSDVREYRVSRKPLIVSPSDLYVSVPEAFADKGAPEDTEASLDVSFVLEPLKKKSAPAGTKPHVLYAEIPEDTDFEELDELITPYLEWDTRLIRGYDYDYPFFEEREEYIHGKKRHIFVIEFDKGEETPRFLLFMIKGIWLDYEDPDAQPLLVQFWNMPEKSSRGRGETPNGRGGSRGGRGGGRERRGGARGGRGGSRGGRGGSRGGRSQSAKGRK